MNATAGPPRWRSSPSPIALPRWPRCARRPPAPWAMPRSPRPAGYRRSAISSRCGSAASSAARYGTTSHRSNPPSCRSRPRMTRPEEHVMNTHEADQQAAHQALRITQPRFYPSPMGGKDKQPRAVIRALKRHPVPAYFVLVYALSWACWIPAAIAGTWLSFPFIVFVMAGLAMPGLVGIVLTALLTGKAGLAGLFGRLGRARAPLIWYAVVLLLIPALQLAAAGLPALLGLATITFTFSGIAVLGGVISALLEEPGWRGFALPRMQARRPAFTASLLLGALWGTWHLPLRVAKGDMPLTAAGLAVFLYTVVLITAWAVMFTWVYNNTGGSLFLMILLHVVADIAVAAIRPGNWIGAALLLLFTWATVALVVVRAGPARLSRSDGPAPGPGRRPDCRHIGQNPAQPATGGRTITTRP